MLIERFGKLPIQVKELFEGLRLQWHCKKLDFERVVFKSNKLRCYFIENPQSPFYESATFNQIMDFSPKRGHELSLQLKQFPRFVILLKEGVKRLKAVGKVLSSLEERMKK